MKPDLQIDGVALESLISNLKLKKSFKFAWLPIECMASATFNLEQRKLSYKLGCKELLLGGKLTLNLAQRHLDYRKRLPFPFMPGSLGRMGWLVLGGRVTLDPVSPHLGGHLSYHFGFEIGQQDCSLASPTSLRIKPRLFFGRVGIEAISQVEVTLPTSLMFESGKLGKWPRLSRSRGDGDGVSRAGGHKGEEEEEEDSFGLKLNVEELNIIVNL